MSLKLSDKKLLLRHRRQLGNKKRSGLVITALDALLYGDLLFVWCKHFSAFLFCLCVMLLSDFNADLVSVKILYFRGGLVGVSCLFLSEGV